MNLAVGFNLDLIQNWSIYGRLERPGRRLFFELCASSASIAVLSTPSVNRRGSVLRECTGSPKVSLITLLSYLRY